MRNLHAILYSRQFTNIDAMRSPQAMRGSEFVRHFHLWKKLDNFDKFVFSLLEASRSYLPVRVSEDLMFVKQSMSGTGGAQTYLVRLGQATWD